MTIYIIAEKHNEPCDVEFMDSAKKMANDSKIILVLENECFDDYENGEIDGNLYAIEDKVIWEYNSIIMAISEIYPALKRLAQMDDMNFMELLQKHEQHKQNLAPSFWTHQESMTEFGKIEQIVNDALDEYTMSYLSFLCNTQENNPAHSILCELLNQAKQDEGESSKLIQLFQHAQEYRECSQDHQKHTLIKSQVTPFIKEHLTYFNEKLKHAAEHFSRYLKKQENNYSEAIRQHSGLSLNWINQYFGLELKHSDSNLINHDTVTLDLRNQLFYERLSERGSNTNGKDIWFIAGEDHLKELRNLFATELTPTKFIAREQKSDFLNQSLGNYHLDVLQTPTKKS